MRMELLVAGIVALGAGVVHAGLGIMDTASEAAAKNGASSVGITQIYDHPADSPNGQFVVPIQYNRTTAEGNGTEHDANNSKPNDIDYVPLSQLKGATGPTGATGAQGIQGQKGDQGTQGVAGANGVNGQDGTNGANGSDGVSGKDGQKGDTGSTGKDGINGKNGTTGKDGTAGKDGKDGKAGPAGIDANIDHSLFVNVGVDVRWYDTKYVAFSSGYRHDLNHHDNTVDALVVHLKLGKSYEQRQLEALEKRVQRQMQNAVVFP